MNQSQIGDVAIIGAGPYGLATAAHLTAAGIDTTVFGDPMSFWRTAMPVGMFLRSSPSASSISDPRRALTLERFAAVRGLPVRDPVPLADFLSYADWFRSELPLEVDRRRVVSVGPTDGSFLVRVDDGESYRFRRVVVAGGIAPFMRRPGQFTEIDAPRVVHSIDVREPEQFAGLRVVVVGSGQSALETAALLHEAGADVSVVARAPRTIWIPRPRRDQLGRTVQRWASAPTEVGPRGVSWIAAVPDVLRRLPRDVQEQITRVCLTPMGAYWLPERLRAVQVTTNQTISAVQPVNGGVRLRFVDGGSADADRVVLATGFEVDVKRFDFLSPEVVRALRVVRGSPVLSHGLESSLPGLHFVGAAATHSFGPVMRFVVGTAYAAPAVTRRILGRPPLPLSRAW